MPIYSPAIRIDLSKVPKIMRPLPDAFFIEDIRFVTTWTKTNFGGHRQWFLCSDCERRCAIIYRAHHTPRWGCRLCLDGHYVSEHLSPRGRRLHAAFKVRNRLGQTKGGILVRFPAKPKGMHRRTYDDIRFTALRHESEILLHAHADLLGVSVEHARNSLI